MARVEDRIYRLLDVNLIEARRIQPFIESTPCVHSKTLSAIAGCELWLKFENLQFTASFKERGALNKLLSLSTAAQKAGVCAMSAGNHAQGVAYHAQRLGLKATIFMPVGTPFTKVTRTRDHGADVRVCGANLSEALDEAKRFATEYGATFIHPYDDPFVIAGQGTLGIEIIDAVPDVDVIVVPIGGGGLISGIALAARSANPHIKIIGVQSSLYPSMANALAGNATPCPDAVTIAEGIAVKTAGEITQQIIREYVDDILLVDEASIERAMALLLNVEKTVVEGAGAAGFAAILQHPDFFSNLKVATPLCGGNVDLRVLSSVAMRELVRSGQLLRFAVAISDQPGVLSKLTAIVGEAGANIVEVGHDRLSLALTPKGAVLDLLVEVQDAAHSAHMCDMLRAHGFEPKLTSLT